MKTHIKIVIVLITIIIAMQIIEYVSRETYTAKATGIENEITHAEDVWINALEWCESHGKPSAINPKDKDNTPSYYSFQFKPNTFKEKGEKYGVIKKGLSDSEIKELMKDQKIQRKILEYMVNDNEITPTIWKDSLFPGCIKKIGLKPNY